MKAISAWGIENDAKEEIEPPPPPPPKRRRGIGPRTRRNKVQYTKRKCASVEAADQAISENKISVGLDRYEVMKKIFKSRKRENAGDDMADALWHAVHRLWLVCKPSIKNVEIAWSQPKLLFDFFNNT